MTVKALGKLVRKEASHTVLYLSNMSLCFAALGTWFPIGFSNASYPWEYNEALRKQSHMEESSSAMGSTVKATNSYGSKETIYF